MAELFDASEFIDPVAITAALKDVQNYQLPAPQQQAQQRTAPPMQGNQNLFPQPHPPQGGGEGFFGVISSLIQTAGSGGGGETG